jgi:hypothetical protein
VNPGRHGSMRIELEAMWVEMSCGIIGAIIERSGEGCSDDDTSCRAIDSVITVGNNAIVGGASGVRDSAGVSPWGNDIAREDACANEPQYKNAIVEDAS